MLTAAVVNQPLPESPWGAPLAAYFVLVGLPSGLTLVAWWQRARWPQHTAASERTATWVALVVLVLAGLLLVVDLGRPERFFLMLTRFGNLGSPISIGAKVIAVKMFLLVVAVYLLRRPGVPALGPVAWGLGVTSVALAIYPVAVLARTWTAPLAGTSGAGLIFVLTALLMGAAAQLAIHALRRPVAEAEPVRRGLRQATLFVLAAHGVTIAFQGLALHGTPLDDAVLPQLMAGSGAFAFWGLVVGVGLVLPAVGLLAVPTRRWAQLVNAGAIFVGACAGRYLVFAV